MLHKPASLNTTNGSPGLAPHWHICMQGGKTFMPSAVSWLNAGRLANEESQTTSLLLGFFWGTESQAIDWSCKEVVLFCMWFSAPFVGCFAFSLLFRPVWAAGRQSDQCFRFNLLMKHILWVESPTVPSSRKSLWCPLLFHSIKVHIFQWQSPRPTVCLIHADCLFLLSLLVFIAWNADVWCPCMFLKSPQFDGNSIRRLVYDQMYLAAVSIIKLHFHCWVESNY